MNRQLPDVQVKYRKGRGTRDQIANIRWVIEKAREFQKNICFIDYAKAFDCVDQNKLENSTELQKPNVEAGVITAIKNVTEEKRRKELRSLIRFHSANKIDNYSRGGRRKKKKRKQ